jgi:alpha-beta hydrolase superfamily lysophospholipase
MRSIAGRRRFAFDETTMTVTLTPAEKLAALHGDVRLPLTAVRDVRVERDGLAAVRGLRAPGLAVPGWRKIGRWRRRGSTAFVLARRGMAAVRVRLAGAAFDELLVSTPDAAAVAEEIRTRAGLAARGRDVEVSFRSAGLTLPGALRLPAGNGPFATAVILPGSGPLDRDGDHKRMRLGVSRDLADALAARGIASLRYDKRGAGAAQGSFLAAGLSDNLADAKAALAWAIARPEVRDDALFAVGHSEGALLASALGGDPVGDRLAGVVLLAGVAKRGEETLVWQARAIAAGLPRPLRLALRLLRVDLRTKQARNIAKLRATTTDVARIGLRRVNARWHRELLAFDPAAELTRLRAPVLAITGAKDIQVDPADLEAIAAAVPGRVEFERPADLTHLLRRDAGPPTIASYRRLTRQPTDPELLARVAEWIATEGGVARR